MSADHRMAGATGLWQELSSELARIERRLNRPHRRSGSDSGGELAVFANHGFGFEPILEIEPVNPPAIFIKAVCQLTNSSVERVCFARRGGGIG
jgi:hypothetical protein